MPTYDAGSIRATADLNRDPFVEGLRLCVDQGRVFERYRFTATADIDTGAARRDLALLQLFMRRVSEEGVVVDVDTEGILAATTELAALRREMQQTDRQGDQSGRSFSRQQASIRREVQQSKREFSLLRVAIEQLGPPLVPIAGGALAAASALAGLGIAGVLALKGIADEYKAGTPLGLRYAGMLTTLKGELAVLQHTAAAGVLDGFDRGVRKTLTSLPALNQEVAISSRNLGSIADHAVGGAVGGFLTFSNLIHTVEGDVDSLAARFESWATGPGGAQFAATITEDYAHLKDFLGSAVPAIEHILSAVNPLGTVMLDNLTTLSSVISDIPVPILTAAATAYLAYRTALLVTAPLSAAAKALDALRASQLATATSTTVLARSQAAAGGWGAATLYGRGGVPVPVGPGVAGTLATATRAVIPYAAAWAGATLAIGAASNATAKWRHEADLTQSSTANALHAARSILTFNLGGVAQARRDQATARAYNATQTAAQGTLNDLGLGAAGSRGVGPFARQPGPLNQFSDEGLADITTRNAAAMRAANLEYRAGITVMRALTSAGRDQGAEFATLQARTATAGASYARLKMQVDQYRASLTAQTAAQRGINRQANTVRDAYAGGQAALLQGVERITFAQSPTLTAGAEGLQKYSATINTAIKNEKAWAEATDHNTVTIRGHHFEIDRWREAMDQANGDTVKAAGILLGHRKALNDDRVAADLAAAQQGRLNDAIGAAERKYALNDQQLNMYATTLGITAENLADGTVSQDEFVTAVGRAKGVIDSANTSTAAWVTALDTFSKGADTAATRGQLLAAAMVSFNGPAISYGLTMANASAANQQFVTAFDKMDNSIFKSKKGLIDYRNAGAQPVLAALQQLQTAASQAAAETYQNEVSTRGRTQAAKDAAAVYRNDTYNALVSERKQLGLTRGEAEKLANRYLHWPKDAKTRLELMGTEGTNRLLNGIGEQLAVLTHHPWIATLNADSHPAQGKIRDLQTEIDRIRQGKVPHLDLDTAAGRAKIQDLYNQIAELDRLAATHITVNVGTRGGGGARASTSAAGNLFKAYAAGGMENHWPQIAKPAGPGMARVWAEQETGGEAYIPLRNDWRRPRARDIASATVEMLGGVAFFAAGGGPGGYVGVKGGSGGSGGSSSGGGGSSGSGGGGGASASTLNALKTLARQVAADALGLKTYRELDKLSSATLQSYAAGLLKQTQRADDLKAAPSSLVKRVKAENAALQGELRTRDKILAQKQAIDAKVAAARSAFNSEVSTVRAANMQGFDITTSGQGYAYGIKASLDKQLADASRYQRDLAKARRMHLSPTLVRQFAEAGPAAMPNLEAIINAGQAYVTGVSNEYAQLGRTAGATGTAEANQLGLGKKLDDALALQRANGRQLDASVHAVNHTLGLLRHDLHTLSTDIKDARRANGGKR